MAGVMFAIRKVGIRGGIHSRVCKR